VVDTFLPVTHESVYLTFTQDSLVDIHDQIDANYKGQKIVGWYHTHPSMGIFLSHYDTWLHRNFFPEPWQVALVVEPVSATAGFFIRQKQGVLDPTRYFGFYERMGTTAEAWSIGTISTSSQRRKERVRNEQTYADVLLCRVGGHRRVDRVAGQQHAGTFVRSEPVRE
jgi:hypothetical protein